MLVPLTFIGGVGMAWLFSKERNILPLALGQAILGSLVWWAFPWRGTTRCAWARATGLFIFKLLSCAKTRDVIENQPNGGKELQAQVQPKCRLLRAKSGSWIRISPQQQGI